MKLSEAIGLQSYNRKMMISFSGGGGKTSSIYTLAYELAETGKKVLITTTTAMYNPVGINHSNITVLGDHVTPEGKLKGISKERANDIFKEECYDFILVEADGSRGRPIKAPAEHEPQVPEATDILIGVIGIDAYGQAVSSSYVHRPEILAELTGTGMEGIIDDQVIIELASKPNGLFKNCPSKAVKILLMNKAISDNTRKTALKVGNQVLKKCDHIDRVMIGAVQEDEPVKELLHR